MDIPLERDVFLRRLLINHQFELGRLLDGQLSGFCALEDFIYISGDAPVAVGGVRCVRLCKN